MLPNSPFTRYFGTNYAPSTREADHINAILHDPLKRLRELDEKISELQAEREIIQTFVSNHRLILSPSRRLPADIWSLVFVQCLPPSEFAVGVLTEAPLLLTRICRWWREIALSTPGLWNTIHINIPIKHNTEDERYIAMMQARMAGVMAWLDRSGSLPLKISISSAGAYGFPIQYQQAYKGIVTELAALLLSYSPRWQTLRVNNVPPLILEALTMGGEVNAPLLRKIVGQGITADEHAEIFYSILKKPGGSINLHTDNDLLHLVRTRHPRNIYWARVSELCITRPLNGVAALAIAQAAELFPHLTTCEISIWNAGLQHHNNSWLSQPIQWKYLKKLEVVLPFTPERDNARFLGLSEIFDQITTPALTHFTIRLPKDARRFPLQDEETQEHPFHKLFIRSECNNSLTHLTIDLPMRAKLVLQSLTLLSSLKFLTIGRLPRYLPLGLSPWGNDVTENSPVWEPLLNEELFHALTSATICPSLEGLTFLGWSPNQADVNALLTLADSRRLKALIIKFGEQPASKAQILGSDYVINFLEQLRVKEIRVDWQWSIQKLKPLDNPCDGL